MDGRFDGLDRVRQGIEIGRHHDLPAVVALGLGADRQRVRRTAPLRPCGAGARRGRRLRREHDLETRPAVHRRRGWPAAGSTSASGTRPRSHAREALGASRRGGDRPLRRPQHAGMAAGAPGRRRRVAAARRGARDRPADRPPPAAVAGRRRPRRGRMAGGCARPHVACSRRCSRWPQRCRHGIADRRARPVARLAPGRDPVTVVEGRRAVRQLDRRRPLGAAAGFRRWAARTRRRARWPTSGDTASLREALGDVRRLGAAPMARPGGQRAARARRAACRERSRRHRRRPRPAGLSEREVEVLQARRGRVHQPADRRDAVHQPQDGRAPRVEHPGQARRHVAHRGGGGVGAAGRHARCDVRRRCHGAMGERRMGQLPHARRRGAVRAYRRPMNRYLIERTVPGAGQLSADELQAIAQKSVEVLAGMAPRVQWVAELRHRRQARLRLPRRRRGRRSASTAGAVAFRSTRVHHVTGRHRPDDGGGLTVRRALLALGAVAAAAAAVALAGAGASPAAATGDDPLEQVRRRHRRATRRSTRPSTPDTCSSSAASTSRWPARWASTSSTAPSPATAVVDAGRA